jgi:hypothetical protein
MLIVLVDLTLECIPKLGVLCRIKLLVQQLKLSYDC